MNAINHRIRCTPSGVHLYYGWFEAMHTRMDTLLVGMEESIAITLMETIYAEIKRLEKRLNRFDPESEISKINNRGAKSEIGIEVGGVVRPGDDITDPEMFNLFAKADRYRCMTEGLFNIAIQTPNFRADKAYYKVDSDRKAIIFTDGEAIFDFGGYAKGYVLDKMQQKLREAGINSALLSFGNSSVSAIGCHPAGSKWQVCVDNPINKSERLATLELENSSISTSGNTPYNKGHIRSTITLESITDSKLLTVSSLSALDCEILSTALFAARDRKQQERIITNFGEAQFLELPY